MDDDLTTPIEQIEHLAQSLAPSLADKQVIMLFNKSDLLSPEEIQSKLRIFPNLKAERLPISAKKTSILTDYNNYCWMQQIFPKSANMMLLLPICATTKP
jgi:50S ribosomal subunit-associated GTPase HflX